MTKVLPFVQKPQPKPAEPAQPSILTVPGGLRITAHVTVERQTDPDEPPPRFPA